MIRHVLGAALLAAAIRVRKACLEVLNVVPREGERAAGPVGAIVGGTIAAVVGGVAGVLGEDPRPRFRTHRRSCRITLATQEIRERPLSMSGLRPHSLEHWRSKVLSLFKGPIV